MENEDQPIYTFFGKEQYSDIKIDLGGVGIIHAHKSVISRESDFLSEECMFLPPGSTITLDQYCPTASFRTIQSMYMETAWSEYNTDIPKIEHTGPCCDSQFALLMSRYLIEEDLGLATLKDLVADILQKAREGSVEEHMEILKALFVVITDDYCRKPLETPLMSSFILRITEASDNDSIIDVMAEMVGYPELLESFRSSWESKEFEDYDEEDDETTDFRLYDDSSDEEDDGEDGELNQNECREQHASDNYNEEFLVAYKEEVKDSDTVKQEELES